MSVLGIHTNESNFYCSYSDDCWVELAKEIVAYSAMKYSFQLPTTAMSQDEYDLLDRTTYLPIRKSILRNVMNGPLRNIANIDAVYSAFEQRRIAYKKSLNIKWEDVDYADATKF